MFIQVPGKIVVYNQVYINYGVSVAYRALGAARAAKHGAVASLIRSVTPLSIDSPHTGMQVKPTHYVITDNRLPEFKHESLHRLSY